MDHAHQDYFSHRPIERPIKPCISQMTVSELTDACWNVFPLSRAGMAEREHGTANYRVRLSILSLFAGIRQHGWQIFLDSPKEFTQYPLGGLLIFEVRLQPCCFVARYPLQRVARSVPVDTGRSELRRGVIIGRVRSVAVKPGVLSRFAYTEKLEQKGRTRLFWINR